MYMLWFKFILGLKFFELVSILFAIVPDYGNEYTTKENKNWTSFKNFAPKLNLNHNIWSKRKFLLWQEKLSCGIFPSFDSVVTFLRLQGVWLVVPKVDSAFQQKVNQLPVDILIAFCLTLILWKVIYSVDKVSNLWYTHKRKKNK